MAKRHGKDEKKDKKKTQAEKRKGVAEAIETLTNVNMAIMCMLCDKTDCVNKFKCKTYKTKSEQFSEDFKELDEKLNEEEDLEE